MTQRFPNLHRRQMIAGWVSDGHVRSAFPFGSLWRPTRVCGCMRGSPLFSLDHVPQGQWMEPMNDLPNLIDQMAMDISGQAVRLDDFRLRLFLNWFIAHNNAMKDITQAVLQINSAIPREANLEEQFQSALKTWLATLPMQGLLWEYHLILNEIVWWRDIDPRQLKIILKDEEMK